jgi:hypothetical protein
MLESRGCITTDDEDSAPGRRVLANRGHKRKQESNHTAHRPSYSICAGMLPGSVGRNNARSQSSERKGHEAACLLRTDTKWTHPKLLVPIGTSERNYTARAGSGKWRLLRDVKLAGVSAASGTRTDYVQSVRFEVFTAVTMKNGVFWDVTLCGSWRNLAPLSSGCTLRNFLAACVGCWLQLVLFLVHRFLSPWWRRR